LEVEKTLQKGKSPVTTLRAAIIIGSGSAAFEIIRDLVEKLPVMIAPKWLKSKCQPIAVRDLLFYLVGVLGKDECFEKSFDVGGPDILTYHDMLLQMAECRDLKRWIIQVPVLTPKLSSYWLFLVTSTNFALATSLIESLKNDAICKDKAIDKILPRKCISYKESIVKAFDKINQESVISSWKDSISSGNLPPDFAEHIKMPDEGCVKIIIERSFTGDPLKVFQCFTRIGGKNGWYFMNWAWKIRGYIDKLIGGVGLRGGRVPRKELKIGDPLDFWRVLFIDSEKYRLLLLAEMKLPGEAWLEFSIKKNNSEYLFIQTITFRPRGLFGRIYWYTLYLPHVLLLKGLSREVIKRSFA